MFTSNTKNILYITLISTIWGPQRRDDSLVYRLGTLYDKIELFNIEQESMSDYSHSDCFDKLPDYISGQ